MGITSDGKWFSVDPADIPVAEAAAEILRFRLADVRQRLSIAAHDFGDDIEPVHQLRVSCRRAAAALKAFRPVTGKSGKRVGRWLRHFRRVAGPARDADVLADRLRGCLDHERPEHRAVLDRIQASQQEARRQLAVAESKWAIKFERATVKCLVALEHKPRGRSAQPFDAFAKASLSTTAAGLEAGDLRGAGVADLHQLRIAAKRLRYEAEIFHSVVRPQLRSEAYPIIQEMQQQLGRLNDHAAAQLRFQQWLCGMPADDLAGAYAKLAADEHQAATLARDEFLRWWDSGPREALRRVLDDSLR